MAISTESSAGVSLALSGAGTKRPLVSRRSVRVEAALASFRFCSSSSSSAFTFFQSSIPFVLHSAWCFSALARKPCGLFGYGKGQYTFKSVHTPTTQYCC